MRRTDRTVLIVGAALLGVVAIALASSALFLDATQYQALAGAVQAAIVVGAFTIGIQTFNSDRRDRQVDRVLKLSEELTSGELDADRRRLVDHLRKHGQPGKTLEVSLGDLDAKAELASYADVGLKKRPAEDARILCRFFERVNAARLGHTVDIPLLHELIGGHAAWLAIALGKDPNEKLPSGLRELADWANAYHDRKASRSCRNYMQSWGESRMRDFGRAR